MPDAPFPPVCEQTLLRTGRRRLTRELLETARDMHARALLTTAPHDKISLRHMSDIRRKGIDAIL